jgi:hypothetical protein
MTVQIHPSVDNGVKKGSGNFTGGTLESFRFCLNRGFPNQECSDSSFLLGAEASMDGASILTGSA